MLMKGVTPLPPARSTRARSWRIGLKWKRPRSGGLQDIAPLDVVQQVVRDEPSSTALTVMS